MEIENIGKSISLSISTFLIYRMKSGAWLAQSGEHETLNLQNEN